MNAVSVIIPVYNVAPYLRQSLDALVGQTLRDIEFICVDDGSTDGSGKILDEYAARDLRFRVVHQANAGAGIARNVGLELATGEYLFFCDADDWCRANLAEEAVKAARAVRADVAIFEADIVFADTGERKSRKISSEIRDRQGPFSPAEIAGCLFQAVTAVPWNKLFRREFVSSNGIRFQPLPRNNDVFFSFVGCVLAERITVVRKSLYWHRGRREGSLHTEQDRNPFTFYTAKEAVLKRLKREGVWEMFGSSLLYSIYSEAIRLLYAYEDMDLIRRAYAELRRRITETEDYRLLPIALKGRAFGKEYSLLRKCEDPLAFYVGMVKTLRNRASDVSVRSLVRKIVRRILPVGKRGKGDGLEGACS